MSTAPADSGNLEKARGKVALEQGYSLMAWMRLSKDADLTGGVGVVDEDEDEETWPTWPLAEVAKHNTPEDAWTVLRGMVYNITPYLRYHPGGIDILMKAAGIDGTALFDKYHAWVNGEAMLAACCVGTLAKEEERRVTWDEEGIEAHDAMRGVMFGAAPTALPLPALPPPAVHTWVRESKSLRRLAGTIKIDQLETPYLYLDQDGGDMVVIHPSYLNSHMPTVQQTGEPHPHQMQVAQLQQALSLVETDAEGCANSRPKWMHAEEFGVQRQVRRQV